MSTRVGGSPVGLTSNGPVLDPLVDAARSLTRAVIGRTLIHARIGGRPIAIIASRRSGSTMLMQTIAAGGNVLFSDQPLSVYTLDHATLNRLPIFAYGQVAYPDADESILLKGYLSDVFSGKTIVNGPWRPWARDFHWRPARVCAKLTDSSGLIEWLSAQFSLDLVLMTRHPFAQALSVMRFGWVSTAKGLLRNESFVSRWLTSQQVAVAERAYAHGEEFEWRVVDWCIENQPLLRGEHPAGSLLLTYESVVTQPEHAAELLAATLQLPDVAAMKRQLATPSNSTVRRERPWHPGSRVRGTAPGIDEWVDRLSARERAAGDRLLEAFRVEIYGSGSGMPVGQAITVGPAMATGLLRPKETPVPTP